LVRRKRLSGSRFRRVFVADSGGGTDFHRAPQHMGSNIGAVGLVAQILGEKFVAPVRRSEARLDCYLRNWRVPSLI
jgi:hypothetical protein